MILEGNPQLFPDLTNIPGLNIHWRYRYTPASLGGLPMNVGLRHLYSRGFSGHESIVCLPVPGAEIDNFPIAKFGEEEGVFHVFASTLKTWFPAYLTLRVRELVSNYDELVSRGKDMAHWDQDIDGILDARGRITDIVSEFENQAFLDLLPNLFENLASRNVTREEYLRYYIAAENGSFVSHSEELEMEVEVKSMQIEGEAVDIRTTLGNLCRFTIDQWKEYYLQNPLSNKGISGMFSYYYKNHWSVKHRQDMIEGIDQRVFEEVFLRPLMVYLGPAPEIQKILKLSAQRIRSENQSIIPELMPMVDLLNNEAYPELAPAFEQLGGFIKRKRRS
jgi:hypothetical protein